MDQCSGQMDVYEVLDDIEKRGLVPEREEDVVLVSQSMRIFPLGKIVTRPLWNRISSPK